MQASDIDTSMQFQTGVNETQDNMLIKPDPVTTVAQDEDEDALGSSRLNLRSGGSAKKRSGSIKDGYNAISNEEFERDA